MVAALMLDLYAKPALGGASPETYVICKTLIFTSANLKYTLITN